MKIIALIPARYASTRFPAKLMQDLGGKTVIWQTYQSVVQTDLFDDVFVVTDSEIIFHEITSQNGKVIMSQKTHESGSDRIAEAIADMDVDIVVNVQGDEPFVDKNVLNELVSVFKEDEKQTIDVASLMFEITQQDEIENPNNVKVVVDHQNFALYFSRAPIPYLREKNESTTYYQHIGVYAFRKQSLLDFTQLNMRPLEKSEKLEQLRYLEYGKKIKMVVTSHKSIGIDTEQDLEKAREYIKTRVL